MSLGIYVLHMQLISLFTFIGSTGKHPGQSHSSRSQRKTIVTSKRTIYHSYLEVPFDFCKHYLYYLIYHILETMFLFGLLQMVHISVQLFVYLWILAIGYYSTLTAKVNLSSVLCAYITIISEVQYTYFTLMVTRKIHFMCVDKNSKY